MPVAAYNLTTEYDGDTMEGGRQWSPHISPLKVKGEYLLALSE